MRLAIIGQQAFGKAVLDAFLARGDAVAAVFVAPEPAGARPDPHVPSSYLPEVARELLVLTDPAAAGRL